MIHNLFKESVSSCGREKKFSAETMRKLWIKSARRERETIILNKMKWKNNNKGNLEFGFGIKKTGGWGNKSRKMMDNQWLSEYWELIGGDQSC